MSEIIFSRTRHNYDSYSDFWRIVELSGYPIVYYDQIDFQSDNLYIHCPMNGSYREHIKNHIDRRCKVGHWLLERPDEGLEGYISANKELVDIRFVDFNIVSDAQLAKDTGFHYVPLGTHADFGTPGDSKIYDFCGLMSFTDHRAWLFRSPQLLQTRVGRLTLAPNGWGEFRNHTLQSSRFGLNIHKDRYPYCEPIRFAIFASYGLPFVTEWIHEGHIYGHAAISCSLTDAIAMMNRVVGDYAGWVQQGLWLRERLTGEFSFRACLEAYL